MKMEREVAVLWAVAGFGCAAVLLAGLACRIRHEDRILRREGLKLKAAVRPSPRDHSCARVHPFFSVCPSLRIRIGGKKGYLAKMAGRKRRELDGKTLKLRKILNIFEIKIRN